MRDPNCIFCKIVAGEIPSYKVYEDETFMCILSIYPQSPGFTLVIPRDHYRWVWDVPNTGKYFELAGKIAHAQRKAFNTDSIWSHIEGSEVPHAHIWVYPNPNTTKGDKMDFEENAEKIKKAIT